MSTAADGFFFVGELGPQFRNRCAEGFSQLAGPFHIIFTLGRGYFGLQIQLHFRDLGRVNPIEFCQSCFLVSR